MPAREYTTSRQTGHRLRVETWLVNAWPCFGFIGVYLKKWKEHRGVAPVGERATVMRNDGIAGPGQQDPAKLHNTATGQ